MSTESLDTKRVTRAHSKGKLSDALLSPSFLMILILVYIVLTFIFPALALPGLLFLPICMVMYADRRYRAPLRMPQDSEMFDETLTRESNEETNIAGFRHIFKKMNRVKAKGIMYLGYERGRLFGREIWLTTTDLLRHMTFFGTTGSGKTESFYGFVTNALSWGRGFAYSDGKADTKLAFSIWSLCRRFGREEDFYVVNLLTGGLDRFDSMVKGETQVGQSNTLNLFSTATPTFIIQLMESMLPKVGGDSAQWQDSAKAMMSALINALCYKRSRGEIILSQRTIEDHMSLPSMAALYVEATKNNWHEAGYLALKTYLENVPGFMLSRVEQPDTWDSRCFEQHNYLSRQFLKTLALFNESYGHVFPVDSGDIKMSDVLHNDRILVVLIPSLELSKSEAATLGKLYITLIRMTIARDLGSNLEGYRNEIMKTAALGHKYPFQLIFDELGQYFAEGIDTLAAQMRSLYYMGVFSSQDHPSLARGAQGEEDSLMANTRTKYFEAIEDEKTYEILRKMVGKDFFSELAGLNKKAGAFGSTYDDSDHYQVREKDRVDIRELRSYTEGQGVISFQDALVRSASFYVPDEDKWSDLPMRINRFIEVLPPSPVTLDAIYPERKFISTQELRAINEEDKDQSVWKKWEHTYKLQNTYTKDINELLNGLASMVNTTKGKPDCQQSINTSIAIFEYFSEWLDENPSTSMERTIDDFTTLEG